MSTNDDSASRRGRRADQGGPAWPATTRRQRDEGWDQTPSGNRDSGAPYSEQRGRDTQSQHAAYSGFTRPSYSQRPEPQQPARPYDPPPQQPYYQDPAPRQDLPRYVEPAAPSYEPQPPQHLGYGDGGRDDLFSREPAPPAYDHSLYGGQSGYQQPYDQGPGRGVDQDYYQREAPSSAESYGTSRFPAPDERPQAPHQRPPAPSLQAPADRGYAPAQSYNSGGYDPNPGGYDPHGGGQDEAYEQHGGYDSRYPPQDSWHGDEQTYHAREGQGGHMLAPHRDELDEDFFGDEDDYEHDDLHGAPKRGRKKFLAAAVAAALVAGGGAYLLKPSGGGNKATPVIRADNRPSKEVPGNPGGKQFPNGEKAIYERLRPDGSTQVAAVTPATAPVAPAFASTSAAPAGNSLEDRIDEALRKAHNGAPPGPAPAGQPGTDQPTVVRSESYSPSGNRIETRPVIQPSISNASNGLPYPFGNAPAAPAAAPADPAPFRTASAPPPQPQFATMSGPAAAPAAKGARTARQAPPPEPVAAAPAPAAASGFYVSLKSAPDEKGIQRDLPALSDKYKSVLGDVQLTTKIADLGAKGVTYRAVAGPLGTMQEAKDLCQKIKGVGGDKACFVTN